MSTASVTSSSTTSLVSNTTVSSRAPLNGLQSKDFQSAFATLQSTYGSSGSAPRPVSKSSKTHSASGLTAPTTVSSRAPLAPKKNFQAAFADLQSTYGFGGAAPSPVPKASKMPSASSSASSKISWRTPLGAPKDFQSAFADLQSTYGFAGAAPSPVPSSKQNSGSLVSKLLRRSSSSESSVPASPSHKTKVHQVPRLTA
ncbi:hypothetical protein C8R43DRAFT_407272 [Mycena crocata]|nr:hypothetical protein C8R43DRAFT_407272 [Mycena crocata]